MLRTLPGPGNLPGLLAAAQVMAAGLSGMERTDRLELGPAYVAAALWRRHGYGRSCALPFWSAPVSRFDALSYHSGIDFQRTYLALRLVEAGVLREMTGRAAWRAFALG